MGHDSDEADKQTDRQALTTNTPAIVTSGLQILTHVSHYLTCVTNQLLPPVLVHLKCVSCLFFYCLTLHRILTFASGLCSHMFCPAICVF